MKRASVNIRSSFLLNRSLPVPSQSRVNFPIYRSILPRSFTSSSVFFNQSQNNKPLQYDNEKPDYYRILGIKRDSSVDDIKIAFRKQAKLYHPDTNITQEDGDSQSIEASRNILDQFKLINEAYSVLSDPVLRREYDLNKFSRASILRSRNEGKAPNEPSPFPKEYVAYDATMKGKYQTSEEEYRDTMYRQSEKLRADLRHRGSMARLSRSKIDVPTYERTYLLFAAPFAVIALWAFNYFMFM
jgi:curved DNA-binding protein CbpA